MKADVYENVTARLVALLESGAADPAKWKQPWRAIGLGHRSAVGRSYRGVNTLLLGDALARAGYVAPVWATYNQWKAQGAQVRKGEHGTQVVLWKQYTRKADSSSTEGETTARGSRGLFATAFSVFNAAQVENGDSCPAMAALEGAQRVRNPEGRDAAAEEWIAATGAEIAFGGDRAYYTLGADRIALPRFEDFDSAAEYYSTGAHELTHWTAHPTRLARDLSGRFGTQQYAAEELIAELGSAFAMARLGLEAEPRADHAHYLASWAKLLKGDARAIFTAASRAQSACDYLFGSDDSCAHALEQEGQQ